MVQAVVSDIVNACLTELSHVPGVGTQIYSAPRLLQYVQNAWLMEIQEMWWPEYMFYQQCTLDGSTGSLTADLGGPISTVDDYSDIAAVFAPYRNRKVREFPQSINPYAYVLGRNSWYMTPSYAVPHRPFTIFPIDSPGPVVVWARQRNTLPFTNSTTVYLDPLLLQYDACWMYATDDGTVPAQVNRFQMLASNRRKQMKSSYAQQPLELDPRFPSDTYMITTEDQGWFIIDSCVLA
jgi:hypothetical protein